jgi:hypothetical protein
MPKADILLSSAAVSRAFSSNAGTGIFLSTRSVALSAKTPVGAPEASRQILPPGGSGVSAVTPVSRSPRLLTHTVCPSLPQRATGLDVSI